MYVKTKQQEFDYPQGAEQQPHHLPGDGRDCDWRDAPADPAGGGGGRPGQAALQRRCDAGQPAADAAQQSRDRVATLAPFLTFDQDPYVVLGEDGRLFWVMDGFTTSDTYPYSSHYQLGDNDVNYMRNSVKVVVDAYNGRTDFLCLRRHGPGVGGLPEVYSRACLRMGRRCRRG